MAAFVSPLNDPAGWNYTITELMLPPALRYGNYKVRALRAQNAGGASLVMPAIGIVRRATKGHEFIEVQTDPFPIRNVVLGLAGGVPTFYFVLPDATGLTIIDDQIGQAGDLLKGGVTDVMIAVVFQDRITRDPAFWASEILAAINDAGGNDTFWEPFASAVNTQTNSGDHAPVLLLDHAGEPVTSASVDLLFGDVVRNVTMAEADMGDLQRTVTRLDGTDPGLWSGAQSFIIRPVKTANEEFQLTLLENPAGAINEIEVTPAQRHVLATSVTSWLAEQFAIPTGETASPLARYTRGNKITAFVNGHEFFDELFHRLYEARVPQGRFDLTGWAMFAETELVKRHNGDPEDFPLTLQQAVGGISAAGGSCRLLPARFLQFEPTADDAGAAEILALSMIVGGVLVLNAFGVSAVQTDPAGIFILAGLILADAIIIGIILSNGGETLEPSQKTVELLDPIPRIDCVLARFPAHVDDNTTTAKPTGTLFDAIFAILQHFGCYHQKLGIIRTGNDAHFGYCGGIDLNPDRLDDANHLSRAPFHDVHTKIEGPAVRDLSISFNQRWTSDQPEDALLGDALAYDPPELAGLGTPGSDIVQVARTYFKAANPSRAFAFAPQGDRTIANSMLAAIEQAREFIYIEDQYLTPPQVYRDALIAKVKSGAIKSLTIVVPGITDQPFGEMVRTQLIADLRTADAEAGGGIVRVGYPRRRYTVPDNELRSSSGKCSLYLDLPSVSGLDEKIVLQPTARVPTPPFWLAVEGELMWVYDEALDFISPGTRLLKVLRGPNTRLVKGGAIPSMRAHKAGAPATVVDLSNIYVHAKVTIVDDVFLCVGSANLNRRSLFHDGEMNIFTMPEALKTTAANPVAALRKRLWAEMLDLPAGMASSLLADPRAAAKLFDRSPLFGNRFVDVDAYPDHLMWEISTGDGIVGNILKGFVFGLVAEDHENVFDVLVDPSSAVENG